MSKMPAGKSNLEQSCIYANMVSLCFHVAFDATTELWVAWCNQYGPTTQWTGSTMQVALNCMLTEIGSQEFQEARLRETINHLEQDKFQATQTIKAKEQMLLMLTK